MTLQQWSKVARLHLKQQQNLPSSYDATCVGIQNSRERESWRLVLRFQKKPVILGNACLGHISWKEALKGYYAKLWRSGLCCYVDLSKRLKMTVIWYIAKGKFRYQLKPIQEKVNVCCCWWEDHGAQQPRLLASDYCYREPSVPDGATGYTICPAVLQTWFRLWFSCYFLTPSLWNGFTLCHFMEVSNLKICFGWGSHSGVSDTLFEQ